MPALLRVKSATETVDLSPYLRVAKDDGMTPDDDDMLRGEFGDPGDQGAPLISLAVDNREQAWPVFLKARAARFDGLVNLVDQPRPGVNASSWTTGFVAGFIDNGVAPGVAHGAGPDGMDCATVTSGISFGTYGTARQLGGLFAAGQTYFAYVWVDPLRTDVRIMFGDGSTPDLAFLDVPNHSAAGLVRVAWTPTADRSGTVYVAATTTTHLSTFHFDLVCAAAGDTGYFDGNSPDADWNAAAYGSTSTLHAGKPGLHRMVAKVNRVLAGALTVHWRDDGATDISHLRPRFGRFEADYDYLRARALWLGGIVRITSRPFVDTGTSRVVATGAAVPPTALPIGPVDGDAPGQLDITLSVASRPAAASSRWVLGYAVVPTDAICWFPPASLVANGGTVIGASGAIASQVLRSAENNSPGLTLPSASAYSGRQRILGSVRCDAAGGAVGIALRAYNSYTGDTLGPTAVIGASQWHVVDFGTLDVDPLAMPNTAPAINIDPAGIGGASLVNVDIGGLLVVPDDGLFLLADDSIKLAPTYSLKETSGRTTQFMTSDRDLSSCRRSAFPGATPIITGKIVPFLLADGEAQNLQATAEVRLRERFVYARP